MNSSKGVLNRRRFLQSAALFATATAGLGLTAKAGVPKLEALLDAALEQQQKISGYQGINVSAVADGKEEYDYIIIGSGAGGGPVAANLAKAGYEVLVLEAGGLEVKDHVYSAPAFHLFSSEDPRMSWNFFVKHYSEIEEHGRRYVQDKGGMLYPRAATVGGCTAHHAMLTLYPENRDWDDLVTLTDDPSWNSFNMRKYFDKVRTWLPIEQSPPSLLLKDQVVARIVTAAALETNTLGRTPSVNLNRFSFGGLNLDPNDASHVDAFNEGLFLIPQSSESGERRGTRERIINTMRSHPDTLYMQTHALVNRVLTEREEDGRLRATGVEFLHREHLYEADPMQAAITSSERSRVKRVAKARREVIVAGGAFNSPQILMLSGIGEREQLEKYNIPVQLELPGVGKNLQDRYEVAVVTEFDQNFTIAKDCTFGDPGDPCLDEYNNAPANRVYDSNGLIAGIKKRYSKGREHPELFIFGSPGRFEGYEPGFAKKGVEAKNYFTWAILKGFSQNDTGTVELRSADPLASPEINFRYFDDGKGGSYDIDAVREGLDVARSINERARQLGWLDQNKDVEAFPGADVQTDEQLKDFIKKEAWGHHASCSNKMGHAGDETAVVDPQFKVRGTSNLRIVDASIFPKIPGLFIVLPIFMIAEKASDDILREAATQA